jgi:hypothetical protein
MDRNDIISHQIIHDSSAAFDNYPLKIEIENRKYENLYDPLLLMSVYGKDYRLHIKEVKKIISKGKYDQLINYTSFDIAQNPDNIKSVLNNCNDHNILIHVVNNLIDVNAEIEPNVRLLDYFIAKSKKFNYLIPYLIKGGAHLNNAVEYMNDDSKKYNITSFHLACKYCSFEVIDLMIKNGAKVFSRNYYGDLPIHYAVCNSDTTVLDYFILLGFDPNINNYFGVKPIHYAVANGQYQMIEHLLHFNIDVKDVKIIGDSKGYSNMKNLWNLLESSKKNTNLSEDQKIKIEQWIIERRLKATFTSIKQVHKITPEPKKKKILHFIKGISR